MQIDVSLTFVAKPAVKRHDTIAATIEESKYAFGENPPKTRLRSGATPKAAAPARKTPCSLRSLRISSILLRHNSAEY